MAKKKEENKWLQIGNFLMGVEKKASCRYVVLKSVSDGWRVYWSEETLMFAMMLNLMSKATEDNNVKEYLHSIISMFFISTTYTHDLIALATKQQMPFCEGVAKLLKEQTDYEASLEKKPTKKEEKKALEEVGEMAAIEEELEKMDAENGAE